MIPHLTILVLAFAHVSDLSLTDTLLLSAPQSLRKSMVFRQLRQWDGNHHIGCTDDVWFDAINAMTGGGSHDDDQVRNCMSAVCSRGWCFYRRADVQATAASVNISEVHIGVGTLSREGMRKSVIKDGPEQPSEQVSSSAQVSLSEQDSPSADLHAGQEVLSACKPETAYAQVISANADDCFTAIYQIDTKVDGKGVRTTTGPRGFMSSLWMVRPAGECQHSPHVEHTFILQPRTITIVVDELETTLEKKKIHRPYPGRFPQTRSFRCNCPHFRE